MQGQAPSATESTVIFNAKRNGTSKTTADAAGEKQTGVLSDPAPEDADAGAGTPGDPPRKPPGGDVPGGVGPEENGDEENHRIPDSYTDEEKEKIRATAVEILHATEEERFQYPAFEGRPDYIGRQMRSSFLFRHGDEVFIALVPSTRSKQEMR